MFLEILSILHVRWLLAIGVGAKILLSVTVNDSDMIKSFQVDLRIIKRFWSMMDDIWV